MAMKERTVQAGEIAWMNPSCITCWSSQGRTVLWSKWGGSLEVRLAKRVWVPRGKFEEFVSRRGNLWSFLSFRKPPGDIFEKRIEVRDRGTQLS